MARDLFYLPSYKNVGTLFEKIASAKAPDAFTQKYLADTLGLKSNGDRALITMLKKLGFVDAAGRPTNSYNLLKNKQTSGFALAAGLREAYKALFEANEKANTLSMEELKGLISQVSGVEQKIASAIAYTFNSIAKIANFTGPSTSTQLEGSENELEDEDTPTSPERKAKLPAPTGLRTDFHFNIQVHLPANGTEETYLNIFTALRRSFT